MRMSSYKKNYTPGRINPFDSSKRSARDRIMNNIGDAMEGNILKAFRRSRFKGIILNGYDTGIMKPTSGGYLFNTPIAVDLGEGLIRWKLNFTIHESFYDTEIGNAFTSFFGKSPIMEGVPDVVMQERIRRMPTAYTDIGSSFYGNLSFGSIVNIYERFGFFFIGEPLGSARVGGYGGGLGGRNGFGNGSPFSPLEDQGQLPEPEKPPQFIVNGVKYVSTPSVNAGARALALYRSAIGAGMTDKSRGWETTPTGRAWISTHIYDGLFPGKGYGLKYGPFLGIKDKESMWSSWFHNLCHKPYRKPFKGRGVYTYFAYPARQAYDVKKEVEANPSAFAGQEFFGLFKPTDVPFYLGDSLFNWGSHRKKAGVNSYESFEGDTEKVGSHMKVYARKDGSTAICHGGNESQKVGSTRLTLKSGDMLHEQHHKKYVAIYKKVKVIGPA